MGLSWDFIDFKEFNPEIALTSQELILKLIPQLAVILQSHIY